MEELLKEELHAGEKILWHGGPEPFETLDVTHKQHVIVKAVLTIGIVFTLCIAYLVFANSKGIELKPSLVVIAMLCAVLASFNYIFQSKKLSKMNYIITDQRIIFGTDILKSLEFAKIDKVEFKKDADGHTSILFGDVAIKSKAHQWRSLSLADAYIDSDTGYCSRFALYAVSNVDEVKKILSNYIPV